MAAGITPGWPGGRILRRIHATAGAVARGPSIGGRASRQIDDCQCDISCPLRRGRVTRPVNVKRAGGGRPGPGLQPTLRLSPQRCRDLSALEQPPLTIRSAFISVRRIRLNPAAKEDGIAESDPLAPACRGQHWQVGQVPRPRNSQ